MNRPSRNRGPVETLAWLCGALLAVPAAAMPPPTRTASLPADLTELSLDDLLKVEVTSVSKHAEPAAAAAAAVYVLTGDEIIRAGVRSIPEALRLVPGLQVARSNANTYRISARGFDSSGDKLQVLVDGRSVYTPLTSAVFWDVLDTFLPDIDRIEVIRGPGATLWGANAVNGVINIITKSARDTLGGAFVASTGTEDLARGALRVGTAVSDAGAARLYVKAWERDDGERADGKEARDGQRHFQGGMRSDWQLSQDQSLMASADLYSGREHTYSALSRQPTENQLSGGNLNLRWSWQASERSTVSSQFSFDHYHRLLPEAFDETRDTYDLGAQHDLWLGERNELTYGVGVRSTHDDTGGPPEIVIFFQPQSTTLDTYSAFVQDQFHFAGTRGVWTVGSKFEHNPFTGFEVQPGTRLGYQLSPEWFTWGAVSRAVRTPNRLDHDIALYCPPPNGFPGICGPDTSLFIGNHDLQSEKLIAWEWGLRYTGGSTWSADLATYYNRYTDLRSLRGLSVQFTNGMHGHGTGGELALNWRPWLAVDVRSWVSLLLLNVDPDAGSIDMNTPRNIEGSSARQQANLRVAWQPAPRWSTQATVRYVGRLARTTTPSSTAGGTVGDVDVPAYTELDLKAAWRPWPSVELALIGNNLLQDRHPEFGAGINTSGTPRSELERSVLIEARWDWR